MKTQQIEKTEQVEKSKHITVDEFMPKWTRSMEIREEFDLDRQGEYEHENGIYIGSGNCCMIGEVHGGYDYDDCSICDKFSYGVRDYKRCIILEMSEAIHIHTSGSLKEFYQFKEKVYNHFIVAHPDKLLRSNV